ncbi:MULTISPECIES: CopG family transcriptional regulator [unclassified Nostoc]|uniref:type II toxin-antitoxin system MazE family antitoxin n=1 Tax=unclassified Nostoc TaxID=2593658 RepID=UPI002AD2B55C|nr:CopG family transcriptional regulator [Nostoc sp. DedQUE03]MDZ7975331.1 CopG family transcriptional regulator [Nostoc sp. DedQUE03]MDZ8045170.1 CopG family transcriptional regulator [Nostoc sp. DedQUE02]
MLKVTITLEEDILRFVDQYAQGNRSAYINTLLAEHRRQILAAEIIAALKQDTEDPEYQAEIAAWDSVAGDGINARE